MNWHLTSPGLEYNRDEGISVYFHCASGDTHLISGLASSLLRSLSVGPQNEDALARSLSQDDTQLQGLDAEATRAAICELLDQLHTIHLVEQF
jgi:PqqD family protein of HPr-rel-A system